MPSTDPLPEPSRSTAVSFPLCAGRAGDRGRGAGGARRGAGGVHARGREASVVPAAWPARSLGVAIVVNEARKRAAAGSRRAPAPDEGFAAGNGARTRTPRCAPRSPPCPSASGSRSFCVTTPTSTTRRSPRRRHRGGHRCGDLARRSPQARDHAEGADIMSTHPFSLEATLDRLVPEPDVTGNWDAIVRAAGSALTKAPGRHPCRRRGRTRRWRFPGRRGDRGRRRGLLGMAARNTWDACLRDGAGGVRAGEPSARGRGSRPAPSSGS